MMMVAVRLLLGVVAQILKTRAEEVTNAEGAEFRKKDMCVLISRSSLAK